MQFNNNNNQTIRVNNPDDPETKLKKLTNRCESPKITSKIPSLEKIPYNLINPKKLKIINTEKVNDSNDDYPCYPSFQFNKINKIENSTNIQRLQSKSTKSPINCCDLNLKKFKFFIKFLCVN